MPQGIVAQLDQFQDLRNQPREHDDAVIGYVKENADRLPPFFLMEMARRFYPSDREEALWWYHVGYIRGLYDALRCADKTAANGLGILNKIAPEVAGLAERDQTAFRRRGLEVLEWRGLYRSEASPWWICSHGERAIRNVAEGRPAQDPAEDPRQADGGLHHRVYRAGALDSRPSSGQIGLKPSV